MEVYSWENQQIVDFPARHGWLLEGIFTINHRISQGINQLRYLVAHIVSGETGGRELSRFEQPLLGRNSAEDQKWLHRDLKN